MSLFLIKLVALVCMFIDHLAIFLFNYLYINYELFQLMRAIGRLAFPIFAFTVANGFNKSSNIRLYLKRLVIFSIISYIPYNLVLNNQFASCTSLGLVYPWYICVFICGLVAATWYFTVLRDASAILAALAVLMPMLRISIGDVYLITADSSVFTTFALSLPALAVVTKCLDSPRKHPELLIQIPVLLLCCYIILPNADYDYSGLVLILSLGIIPDNRRKQTVLMFLWCLTVYYATYGNVYNFIGSCLACILLMLYNGERGRGSSKLFYYFYPAHLLLLGLLRFTV